MFSIQTKETVNKTFRFPVNLLTQLELTAHSNNVPVSNLIFQACEYALKSLNKGDFTK